MEQFDIRLPGELERLHELAASANKIALDDPRVAALRGLRRGHTQYGNNFFSRFIGLRAMRVGQTVQENPYVGYARDAEIAGIDMLTFYDGHPQLCEGIFAALDGLEPYDALLEAGLELLRIGRLEDAKRLNEAVGHPWGIEAVGTYAWDRLNPLLEEAATHMAAISPRYRELFG